MILPEGMELNQLMSYIKAMKKRRGFDCTNLEQEFLLFSEEVGELAHELRKIWRHGGVAEAGNQQELAFEIVDCLIYLLSIANMAGIEDIEDFFLKKENLNYNRFEAKQ